MESEKKKKNPWAVPFEFSMCVCILLAYIVQTTRVHFDNDRFTKNKMSLWPYYMMISFLLSQITLYTFENYGGEEIEPTFNYAVYQSLIVVNCFWWSSIVVVQSYEWNLIASLVRYQRKF